MKKYRVLIVAEDSIFSNSIELLLVLQENLEIVSTVADDIQVIASEIECTRPDVVIINSEIATAHTDLVMTLLKTYTNLRVITVRLDDNRINVYGNREVPVTTIDDLVSAITENK